jgi:tripartite-type tricarboxylate transporter receptor subunit TctC
MRKCLLFLSTLAALLALPASAAPDAYPQKPIKIVLPFPAGSGSDVTARMLAHWLTAKTGQPAIVENRPGASGFIAAQAVARADPDGYTVLLTTNTTHAANPALFRKLPYDPVNDFEPVSMLGSAGLLLVVPADGGAKDIASFLAQLRQGGRQWRFGFGNSSSRIAAEMLRTATGADMLAVPYKGTPAALTDAIGKQIDFVVVDIGGALPLVMGGKLRALASTGASRELLLRDVPTLQEAGLKNFEIYAWSATFLPAKTPKPVVTKLNALVREALADPKLREEMATAGGRARSSTPDELRAFVRSEITKWGAVVKSAGIQPE